MKFTTILKSLAALSLTALSGAALAQAYPNKPIRVLVGYGAGGITDIVVRVSTEEMGRRMGQTMVIENRPGASAAVAGNAVRTSALDGYTLYGGPVAGFAPVFLKDASIDASKALAPISMLGAGDWFMYVPTNLPINNLKDLTAYAKSNPLRFSSPSTVNTMLMALIAKRLDFKVETSPYKATDQTITSMLNGDTQVSLNAASGFAPFLQSGRLRVISTLSSKRLDIMPNVPSAIEQGLPLETYSQISLWAPLGTPADIIAKLNVAAVDALKTPAVMERFRNVSYNPQSSSPQDLIRRTDEDIKLLVEAAALIGFQPQ
jgi:tripartite-type tricarboxylate transporter receptor subunit TctC